MADLAARYGNDTARWRTPVVNHTFLTTNFMGTPQAWTDELLTLPSYMNRGAQNDRVMFADGTASMCTVAPPGQSGFVAPDGRQSSHYDDQMTFFKDFGCKSERFTPAQLDQHLESSKQLNY
jgi:penicillin amidase